LIDDTTLPAGAACGGRRAICDATDPASLMEGRINHVLNTALVGLLVILRIELRRRGGQCPK